MMIPKVRSRIVIASLVVAALLVWAGPGMTQTGSRLIPFQARLTDASGNALPDSVYPMTFTIYDQATNGTALWNEQHPSVSVIGGRVNVLLGAINTALEGVSFAAAAGPRFLEIKVGDGGPLVPRHELVPAFQARRADVAEAVKEGGVTTQMLADGAVSGAKVATGERGVSGANVVDGSLTDDDLAAPTYYVVVDDTGNLQTARVDLTNVRTGLASMVDLATDRFVAPRTGIYSGIGYFTTRNTPFPSKTTVDCEASNGVGVGGGYAYRDSGDYRVDFSFVAFLQQGGSVSCWLAVVGVEIPSGLAGTAMFALVR